MHTRESEDYYISSIYLVFINLVQFMNDVRDLNLTISLSYDLIMSLCWLSRNWLNFWRLDRHEGTRNLKLNEAELTSAQLTSLNYWCWRNYNFKTMDETSNTETRQQNHHVIDQENTQSWSRKTSQKTNVKIRPLLTFEPLLLPWPVKPSFFTIAFCLLWFRILRCTDCGLISRLKVYFI